MPSAASSPQGAGSRSGSSTILISSRPSTSTFVLAKRLLGEADSPRTPSASAGTAGSVSWPGSLARVCPAVRLRGAIGSQSGRGCLHGANDLGVGAAATEVAAHREAHLVDSRIAPPREQRRRSHELARGAESALKGVELDEGSLQ